MEYLLFFGFVLLIGASAFCVQNAQFDASKPIGNLAAWRSRRIVNPKTGATVVQWSQAIYANGVHPLQPDAERWITSWTEWAEYPRPVNTPPPGSPEAVAAGCLCGVPERAGDVVYFVRVVNYSTWYVYVNPACPLHGNGAPDADAQGGE